jgi:large subunit ribosomal protein L3
MEMLQGILGKKIGMTQVFTKEGRWVPVTVLQAGPCVVTQTKTTDRDGYTALQLGFDEQKPRRVNKPLLGQFTKSNLKPCRLLKEFRVDDASKYQVGQEVRADVLKGIQWVDVQGVSKGKGYQGVMKRHNFGGGANSHGSMFHRAPGGIGASSDPSRVIKGLRLPGHMGSQTQTAQKLLVVDLDAEKNLVLVRGSVPGGKRGYVVIARSKKAA